MFFCIFSERGGVSDILTEGEGVLLDILPGRWGGGGQSVQGEGAGPRPPLVTPRLFRLIAHLWLNTITHTNSIPSALPREKDSETDKVLVLERKGGRGEMATAGWSAWPECVPPPGSGFPWSL